jgi:dihydrolipoamide dehydrogenase
VEVELAGLFALLGSQVTLLAEGEQLLPQEDYEVGQRLQSLLEAQGVQVLTKATLRSLRWEGNTLAATVVTRQGEVAAAADCGIWAGREPATAGLGLDKVGAKLRNGAVAVDRRMATEVPGLYAVGDAVGGGMLSAVATAQGLVAAENALGQRRLFDERAIPRCLHTVPEVASVGLTELQAEDRGYAVEVSNIPFAINARAMALGEVEGTVKIVAEGKYKKILGVHIVGHRASELIGEAALAIQLEATAEDLAWGIRYHPTLAETQGEAARALFSRAIYLPRL